MKKTNINNVKWISKLINELNLIYKVFTLKQTVLVGPKI